jgi:CBS domain-containing membrane protein
MARAAIGAALGLLGADLVLWALGGGQAALIAPFGATAFLIFVFPASPLAQPWPVFVGNTLSALAAFAVQQLGLPVLATICLAVALALIAMALAEALHPPGGAIAIATVLADPDLSFVLTPVAAGSVALVLVGLLWHRAMGLPYPPRPAP